MKSLKGQLLVASPYLRDSVYSRSVILLLDHDDEGALGVVLNQPLPAGSSQPSPRVPRGDRPRQEQIRCGGPVKGTIVALRAKHQTEPGQRGSATSRFAGTAATPSAGSLSGADNLADILAGAAPSDVRLFVGSAQWGGGQLEEEIRQGVWFMTPATPAHVFSNDDQLWANTLRQVGRELLRSVLHTRHFPDDPSVN